MEKVQDLLSKLSNHWSYWEEYETEYLTVLLPKLMKNPNKGDSLEQEIIHKLKEVLTNDEWYELPQLVVEIRTGKLRPIKKEVEQEKRIKLEQIKYEHQLQRIRSKLLTILKQVEVEKVRLEQKQKEKIRLERIQYEQDLKRVRYILLITLQQVKIEKVKHEQKQKEKIRLERIQYEQDLNRVRSKLLFTLKNVLKNREIHKKIKDDLNIDLSSEQLEAVVDDSPTVLLSARAGSGKTRVSTIKAYYLIKYKKIRPTEIKLVAFNRDAAFELQERFKNYNLTKHIISSTFHSLAMKIVAEKSGIKKNSILVDGDDRVDYNRLNVIENILSKICNNEPDLKEEIYNLFKDETNDIEDNLTNEEFVERRKDSTKYTLGLEIVDGIGEKYIGDFLFEHELRTPQKHWYKYSKPYKYYRTIYRPAYTIKHPPSKTGYNLTVIDFFDFDDNEYCENYSEIKNKRYYWSEYYNNQRKNPNNKVNFIEMNRQDLKEGRENFELVLKKRLEDLGVKVRKLSIQEIYNKIDKTHISKLSDMISMFISKALKNNFEPYDIEMQLENSNYNAVTNTYIKIANKVFSQYLLELEETNRRDFDLLLKEAKNVVQKNLGNVYGLLDLKYLLIDEYQDFSPLFYELIDEIKKYNKDLHLFCVGDDWQAINSFAGSKLDYFLSFKDFFPDSKKMHLLTNYRSSKNIIDQSNKFMSWTNGKGAIPNKHIDSQDIYHCSDYEKVYYDYDDLDPYETDSEGYEKNKKLKELLNLTKLDSQKGDFVENNKSDNILERIASILILPENLNKDVLILSRVNHISGKLTLNKLKIWLRKFYNKTKIRNNIQVMTIHKSKGLEASIVIILEVNNDKFPLIHPNSEFDEFFGITKDMVKEEEKRLFYVALTRAKEKVFLLSDHSKESDFIDNIYCDPFEPGFYFNHSNNSWYSKNTYEAPDLSSLLSDNGVDLSV